MRYFLDAVGFALARSLVAMPSMLPLFRFSLMASLLGTTAAFGQAALTTGGAHYAITQAGKPVGDAQFSAAPISGGKTLTSSGHLKLEKFAYSFSSTATVDAQFNLVHDQLSGSVHGAKASANNVQFTTASDATGRSFQININTDGKLTSNAVDRHRNTVLAPDLDPAAYTLMTHIALSHPQSAWVLIPKENGILVPAQYQPAADLNGTLNGQNISVKHTIVALSDQNSIVIELFYTADAQLLEADLNAQNFYVTRDGFKLLNRPKPVAPPHGQAPQQDTTTQPATPQTQAPPQ
ncbi:hypothetical protein [Acidipila sp. EB88]|uniref:hypothetical protein n=1 Tax=Acidipila sp. EB88 TaxID=2305226 RepID=UPI000F5F8866|nr:hypothetical protein [Acidipila sp. EB88]